MARPKAAAGLLVLAVALVGPWAAAAGRLPGELREDAGPGEPQVRAGSAPEAGALTATPCKRLPPPAGAARPPPVLCQHGRVCAAARHRCLHTSLVIAADWHGNCSAG